MAAWDSVFPLDTVNVKLPLDTSRVLEYPETTTFSPPVTCWSATEEITGTVGAMMMVLMTSALPGTLAVSVIVPATVPVITVTLGAVVLPLGMVNVIERDPFWNTIMLSVPPAAEGAKARVRVPVISPVAGADVDTPIPGCWPEPGLAGTTMVSGRELTVIVIVAFANRPLASVARRVTGNAPVVFAAPLITPVDAPNCNPPGAAETIVNVYGGTPPPAVTV